MATKKEAEPKQEKASEPEADEVLVGEGTIANQDVDVPAPLSHAGDDVDTNGGK